MAEIYCRKCNLRKQLRKQLRKKAPMPLGASYKVGRAVSSYLYIKKYGYPRLALPRYPHHKALLSLRRLLCRFACMGICGVADTQLQQRGKARLQLLDFILGQLPLLE